MPSDVVRTLPVEAPVFTPGYRMPSGNALQGVRNLNFSAGLPITAHAGGGFANATLIRYATTVIEVCASSGDSVKLPIPVPGMLLMLENSGAQTARVYAYYATDQIDGMAGNVGVTLASNESALFRCGMDGVWISVNGAVVVPVREKLLSAQTWYVRSGGTGDGTIGSPFGAVQDAIDAYTAIDCNGFDLTVDIGAGNWGVGGQPFYAPSPNSRALGGGITFSGAGATTVISLWFVNDGFGRIQHLTIDAAQGDASYGVYVGEKFELFIGDGVLFQTAGGGTSDIWCYDYGSITSDTLAYTVKGSKGSHCLLWDYGKYNQLQNTVVTASGTVTFLTACFDMIGHTQVRWSGSASGTFVGERGYINSDMAQIYGTRSTIPGDATVEYDYSTWSPAVTGSTGNPTITYTSRGGNYTRAGPLVYVEGFVIIASISGGSGDARFSLPLKCKSFSSASQAILGIDISGVNWGASKTAVFGAPTPGAAYMRLSGLQNDSTELVVPISALTAGDYVYYAGVYMAGE